MNLQPDLSLGPPNSSNLDIHYIIFGSVNENSRFFRVPLEHIGYLRAIVEGYDGLAQLYAREADRGEVELVVPAGRAEEADALVQRLARETGWVEIPRPADWESF